MTTDQAQRYILVGFAIAVVAISFSSLRGGEAPPPWRFVGSTVLYGIAAVGSEIAPGFGAFLTLAYTAGLLYALVEGRPIPFVPSGLQPSIPVASGGGGEPGAGEGLGGGLELRKWKQ